MAEATCKRENPRLRERPSPDRHGASTYWGWTKLPMVKRDDELACELGRGPTEVGEDDYHGDSLRTPVKLARGFG
jgi:hypothetical protein